MDKNCLEQVLRGKTVIPDFLPSWEISLAYPFRQPLEISTHLFPVAKEAEASGVGGKWCLFLDTARLVPWVLQHLQCTDLYQLKKNSWLVKSGMRIKNQNKTKYRIEWKMWQYGIKRKFRNPCSTLLDCLQQITGLSTKENFKSHSADSML